MEACLLNTQYRMSCNEKKDASFAYESSVHSRNLLLRLNKQREQDLLCDVTVVAEDQRFRAHRSVLAACSEYFLSRVVQPCDGDFVITLPEEVTVKGFGPLLQFAYTSKLLVNKDNLTEIRKCADILEIHDVEESCFQFLKLKYLGSQAEPQECPRKKCCKSFCPKVNIQLQEDNAADLEIDEVEELWREEFPQSLKCPAETENVSPVPESPNKPCETFCFDRESVTGISSLCPKYRKFQKAFKSDRIRSVSTCSSNQDVPSPSSVQSSETSDNASPTKSQGNTDVQLINKVENQPIEMEGSELNPKDTNVLYHNPTHTVEKTSTNSAYPPCFSVGPHDFSSVPFPCAYQAYKSFNYVSTQNDSNILVLPEKTSPGSDKNDDHVGEFPRPKLVPESGLCMPEEQALTREHSNVEREVAEHLLKGFLTGIYNNEFPCQPEIEMVPSKASSEESNSEKRPECPWLGISISESPERTFTTLSSVTCPFISTLSSEGCTNNSELRSDESVQETSPFSCSVTLEEDSETDTEGDSESGSAKEQECEVCASI
ncbi:hypothetical protein FKM82_019591 [Ascaphus truei]